MASSREVFCKLIVVLDGLSYHGDTRDARERSCGGPSDLFIVRGVSCVLFGSTLLMWVLSASSKCPWGLAGIAETFSITVSKSSSDLLLHLQLPGGIYISHKQT